MLFNLIFLKYPNSKEFKQGKCNINLEFAQKILISLLTLEKCLFLIHLILGNSFYKHFSQMEICELVTIQTSAKFQSFCRKKFL